MDEFLSSLKERAKQHPKRIVFPETADDRILQAADILLREGLVHVILLGDHDKILWRAGELHLDISKARIINPAHDQKDEVYAKTYYEFRKHKGVTLEAARKTVKHPTVFATMMVHEGAADGLVSGATHTTAETLRPALQIIKTKDNIATASSFFFMVDGDRVFFFADCAFVKHPSEKQLAEIAIATAASARQFGFEPKVALLSFSTHGSARDPLIDKVRRATEEVKHLRPDLLVDGEIQLDAAIVAEVAAKKCPDSPLQGQANVLIFPDLDAGNIGYKLVQRFAHVRAIGPIIQGLKKPVNDLSRGCSVEDIVDVAVITSLEVK